MIYGSIEDVLYEVSDFSKEEERRMYEKDHLSPFPDKDGKKNYPSTKYEKEIFLL